jgi:acyl carrier protein
VDETQARLANCFIAVFPELTEGDVATASSDSVASWDSVSTVTLVAVVEEEFDISIDVDDPALFSSFNGVLAYLHGIGQTS